MGILVDPRCHLDEAPFGRDGWLRYSEVPGDRRATSTRAAFALAKLQLARQLHEGNDSDAWLMAAELLLPRTEAVKYANIVQVMKNQRWGQQWLLQAKLDVCPGRTSQGNVRKLHRSA